jgi:RNA polymerase sigma-70 factor (ECF subfamily)
MSRFQDKSAEDIAEELKLSRRTVENHLFISRKEVREFIRRCI